MNTLTDLAQNGAGWLFIPSAILLGALHGLEPGHSKTMMAAFIVAIRGTITQAMLLAVTATVSHTAIVWMLALLALRFGPDWATEANEPYFQLASAALILGIAGWMFAQTLRHRREMQGGHVAPQTHDHDHPHRHGHDHGHSHPHHHHHGHDQERTTVIDTPDAHERTHAAQIENRFAGRKVTNAQIALFGLTGGLLPCSAAVTVLVLCLQLQKFWLGVTLVLCFSIGLALTLLASGVVAAWGIRHASRRWPGMERLAQRAPYLSFGIIAVIGLYVGWQGLKGLGL